MRVEVEKYQRQLKLSNSLMEIYPTIEAENHEDFLLQLLKSLHEDREEKDVLEISIMLAFMLLNHLAIMTFPRSSFQADYNSETLKH